jgi:hypothetical protein
VKLLPDLGARTHGNGLNYLGLRPVLGKTWDASYYHQPKPQQAAEEKAVNLKSRILELPHWFFVSPGVPLQCQISAGMMIARLWHWKT